MGPNLKHINRTVLIGDPELPILLGFFCSNTTDRRVQMKSYGDFHGEHSSSEPSLWFSHILPPMYSGLEFGLEIYSVTWSFHCAHADNSIWPHAQIKYVYNFLMFSEDINLPKMFPKILENVTCHVSNAIYRLQNKNWKFEAIKVGLLTLINGYMTFFTLYIKIKITHEKCFCIGGYPHPPQPIYLFFLVNYVESIIVAMFNIPWQSSK